jgi:ketosteroid isomerase-like protein
MSYNDFEAAVAASHEALRSMAQGDIRPTMQLYSTRDDVTLANPLGPPIVGWANIEKEAARVAAGFTGGFETFEFDEITRVVTPQLGYLVGIERATIRRVGSDTAMPLDLRVTTVFRREEDGWKLTLRHADRITTAQA